MDKREACSPMAPRSSPTLVPSFSGAPRSASIFHDDTRYTCTGIINKINTGVNEGFNDWGGRGYDDCVPGEVTKTDPSGDETT